MGLSHVELGCDHQEIVKIYMYHTGYQLCTYLVSMWYFIVNEGNIGRVSLWFIWVSLEFIGVKRRTERKHAMYDVKDKIGGIIIIMVIV